MMSQSEVQCGFVLDSVHNPNHRLCFTLPSLNLDISLFPLCIHCILHALHAQSELKLSKRAIFALLVSYLSKHESEFEMFLEYTDLVISLLLFSSQEPNFAGYASSMRDREQLLGLFNGKQRLQFICLQLLAHASVLIHTQSIQEISWIISILERFSELVFPIGASNDEDTDCQLLSAFSDVVRDLYRTSFVHLMEGDKVRVINIMQLVQYEPDEQELDIFVEWIAFQLERACETPLLAYHLLNFLRTFLDNHDCIIPKIGSVINFYLVHEEVQIESASQSLFSLLLRKVPFSLLQSYISRDSFAFAMESIMDILSKFDSTRHGTSLMAERSFFLLSQLHQHFADDFRFIIGDIMSIIWKVALNNPILSNQVMDTLDSFMTDPTLFNFINSESLGSFIFSCSMNNTLTIEDRCRMLSFSTRAISLKIFPTPISLIDQLEVLLQTSHQIYTDYIYHLPQDQSEELDIEVAKLLRIFWTFLMEAGSSILPQILNRYISSTLLVGLERLSTEPPFVFVLLELFLKIFNKPDLTPWIMQFLHNFPIMTFLVRVACEKQHDNMVHSILLALLERILSNGDDFNQLHAWTTILGPPASRIHPSFDLRGAAVDLSPTSPDSFFNLTIDLLHLGFVLNCDTLLIYLVDSQSVFGKASAQSPWKSRLKHAISGWLSISRLCRLSPIHLVRLCGIWSECSNYNSDSSSITNQMLVDTIGGSTLDLINLLVPIGFKHASVLCPPTFTFLTWMFDHCRCGTMLPSLQFLHNLAESEISLISPYLTILATHPKCIQLLIDTYASSAVCKPILTPFEALKLLNQISRLFLLNPSDSPLSNPSIGFFAVDSTSSVGRVLANSSFPLEIPSNWKTGLSLMSLKYHAEIIMVMLLFTVVDRNNLPSPVNLFVGAKEQAMFLKFWKSLDILADELSAQTDSSQKAVRMADVRFYEEVDVVVMILFNIWNVLLEKFRPPLSLVHSLMATPTLKRMFTSFRPTSSSTTPSLDQAIALVEKSHQTKNTTLSLTNIDIPHFSPSIPSSVLSALYISLFQTVNLTSIGSGSETLNSISSRLLKLLHTSSSDNPLFKLIASHSLGQLVPLFLHKGSGIAEMEEEKSTLLLASISTLLSLICTDSDGILATVSLKSLLRISSASSQTNWLKLPQILFLAQHFIQPTHAASPLSECGVMFIVILLMALSRSHPSQVPHELRSFLVRSLIARKLLLSSLPSNNYFNLLGLYHLLRCGLWKSLLDRDKHDANSLKVLLTSLLTKAGIDLSLALTHPPSRSSRSSYFLHQGVVVPAALLNVNSDLPSSSSRTSRVQWVKTLQLWLNKQ